MKLNYVNFPEYILLFEKSIAYLPFSSVNGIDVPDERLVFHPDLTDFNNVKVPQTWREIKRVV